MPNLGTHLARGQSFVPNLRNRDRIAGTILFEETKHGVRAVSWIKGLALPLSAIQRREFVTNAATTTKSVKPMPANTNALASATATPHPPPKPAEPPPKPSNLKLWTGKLSGGTDTQFGSRDRNHYAGGLNLTYAWLYQSNPKQFFRNTFDYVVDCRETEGVKSSDRINPTRGVDRNDLQIRSTVGACFLAVRQVRAGVKPEHLFHDRSEVGQNQIAMHRTQPR